LITPTAPGIPRKTDFRILTDALDYAAGAETGFTFYSPRGEPVLALGYGLLRERVEDVAGRLSALPLAPGDRVALIGETSPDFLTAFLACIRVGLVPAPLPVAGVFVEPDRYGAQIARQIASSGARLLLRPDGPAVQPAGSGTPELSWSDLAALPAAAPRPVTARPDDLCYLQYSSGSTRFPRGIGVTHRALLCNCREIAEVAMRVREDDRVVSWLPLYHDMGLVGTFLASLAAQVSVDFLATDGFARRPLVWLDLISRNRATISYAPSFGYDLCRRRAKPGQIAGLDLSSWRVAGVGAELIDPAVIDGFVETFAPAGFSAGAVLPSYGLAEATLGVTFAPLGEGLRTDRVDADVLGRHRRAVLSNAAGGRAFVRCGRPLPSQRLEIRDETGAALPPRVVGRVFIRGESVMAGYYDDPAATAAALRDGWLDTGDIGYLAEGELVIVGRAKDTIIVNGRNIWPQDLEWAAEQLAEVRPGDCAAFGAAEPGCGERAILLVQCRLADAAARAALAESVHRRVREATGVDVRVVLVPAHSLPRTSSGKLNRGLARERYLGGAYGAAPGTAEAEPAPRQVVAAR
jgi:fatty-acyl-CoA synthase